MKEHRCRIWSLQEHIRCCSDSILSDRSTHSALNLVDSPIHKSNKTSIPTNFEGEKTAEQSRVSPGIVGFQSEVSQG